MRTLDEIGRALEEVRVRVKSAYNAYTRLVGIGTTNQLKDDKDFDKAIHVLYNEYQLAVATEEKLQQTYNVERAVRDANALLKSLYDYDPKLHTREEIGKALKFAEKKFEYWNSLCSYDDTRRYFNKIREIFRKEMTDEGREKLTKLLIAFLQLELISFDYYPKKRNSK
jgi:hypothetical protein